MKSNTSKKLLLVLACLLTAAAFFLAPLHHHEDGDHHTDCALCRLVQTLTLVVLSVVVAILTSVRRPAYPVVLEERLLPPLFLASPLGLRAPPAGF